jgi:CHAD domain-containing protein
MDSRYPVKEGGLLERALMAFRLNPAKSIKRQLKRIARTELGNASRRLHQDHGGDAIHKGRTSVKKVEAVVRLLDEIGFAVPRKQVKRLRFARRALSALRDAEVMSETFDHLQARFPNRVAPHTSAIIQSHLAYSRTKNADRARRDDSLARAAAQLSKTRRSAKRWAPPSIEPADLPAAVKRGFRASRTAMTRARKRRRAEDFHGWRRHAKDLWYQCRLAEGMVSGLATETAEFKKLETMLGEQHNLAVLRSTLDGATELDGVRSDVDEVIALAKTLEDELGREAIALGTRLHAVSPKQFARDLRRRLMPEGSEQETPASPPRPRAVA